MKALLRRVRAAKTDAERKRAEAMLEKFARDRNDDTSQEIADYLDECEEGRRNGY